MSEEIRVITKAQYDEYMELKKQFVDSTKKVRWMPKNGETYWHIYDDGTIGYDFWTSENDILLGRYKLGNCFQTEEEAQKELNRRIAERELLDLCNGMYEENHFILFYHPEHNFFSCRQQNQTIISTYRFKDMDSADKAINMLGTEKLKLILRVD